MACFTAPLAEAIIVSAAKKVIAKKEKAGATENASNGTILFSEKLGWLEKMLWGGSALLAFEHVWHGEVVPYFPFLTAAENPEDFAQMLREIAINGVGMALLVTAVWGVMLYVSKKLEKRYLNKPGIKPAL